MEICLTPAQAQRIREMGGEADGSLTFSSEKERESAFQKMVSELQSGNLDRIRRSAEAPERHRVGALEDTLAKALVEKGFIEVKTPMMISADSLAKMGIDENHPLWKQVFWIGPKKALRPMLAPNLYFLMRHLRRSVPAPLLLFEIGPCFRKESRGSNHLEEFTMLNLVELAPKADATGRLKEHIATIMGAVGLPYELVVEGSEVYGTTMDVEVGGTELASGAVGPLPMDKAHGITEPWAGVGFGLERIALMQSNEQNIKKVGRSLIYVNGARIDI